MESFFNEPRLKKKRKQSSSIKTELTEIDSVSNHHQSSSQSPNLLRLTPIHPHSSTSNKRKIPHTSSNQSNKKNQQNSNLIRTADSTCIKSQEKIQQTPSPTTQLHSSSPFSITHPLEPNLPKGRLTSASKLVNLNRKSYKIWFNNQPTADPTSKTTQDPFVRVLYPSGRHETFPLLIPKSEEDEYRPIDDLLNVMTTTLTYYLTPDQSKHYFSEPHPILPFYSSQKSHSTDFRFLSDHKLTRTTSSSSSPSQEGEENLPESPLRNDQPTDSKRPLPKIPVSHPTLDLSSRPLLKSLSKSIRKKNGQEFIQLIDWYNRVIKFLVQEDLIKKQVGHGLPKGIWEIILRQSYDRQISTNLEVLQNYEAWSSNVYGELKPSFVESILNELIDLRPDQVFLDLGSGIGNIVLQVALQIGCVSVGFEIMDGYSDLAVNQRYEVVGRADQLWNVKLGLPVLLHADFTKDPRVGKWLQQADVVLVNNQVFTPTLNESLTLLFLELKESAKIISLKPFIPNSFKLNQRNLDSPLSILTKPNVKQVKNSLVLPQLSPGVFSYPANSVSWTCNPGKFFLSIVDRSRLINFEK